uniref:Attacin n=1 Tax=Gomphocerus sibiricus TaxID=1007316 RepID=A0A2I6BQ43_9ORTH|nr:attacin [Gomphocerus sibiricus]
MKAAVILVVLCAAALSCAFPSPKDKDDRGKVDVDVHREKGVGTVVGVQGQGNVWKSDDGNTRVDADGSWQRVYRGPAAGKPNYSGGIRFSHRW